MPNSAFESVCFTVPGVSANADLTGNQYRGVEMSSLAGEALEVREPVSSGDYLIGVLQNKPNINEAATVATIGSVSKCISIAAIAAGARVAEASIGKFATASTGDYVLGYALTATTAANQIFSVFIDPAGKEA